MYEPKPLYKLLDWIDINNLNWAYLSTNPNAIPLLEKNPDKIYWDRLSTNPNAIHLLEENPNKILWTYLSKNPSIFELDYEALHLCTFKTPTKSAVMSEQGYADCAFSMCNGVNLFLKFKISTLNAILIRKIIR